MATVSNDDVMRTADGVPLKIKLRRAERMRKVWAIALVAPLFLFLVVGFILPIISLLTLSVEDPDVTKGFSADGRDVSANGMERDFLLQRP